MQHAALEMQIKLQCRRVRRVWTMNQFEPRHRIRSQRTEPIHHVLRLDGLLTHAIFRKHALHHLTRIGTAWKLQTGKGKSTWHLQQFDSTLFAILPDMTIQTPNSSSFQHPQSTIHSPQLISKRKTLTLTMLRTIDKDPKPYLVVT